MTQPHETAEMIGVGMASELARLRRVNAKLVEACEAADELLSKLPEIPNHEGWGTSVILQCRAALAAAKE